MKALSENNFQPLKDSEQNKKPASQYWARWIRKVFEVNPLECPKCGENMKIKAILHNPNEIARICENLNISDWRAPPPFTKAGVTLDGSPEFVQ